MYADRSSEPLGDDIKYTTLLMPIFTIAYADSLEETKTMLEGYENVHDELQSLLIANIDVAPKTWDERPAVAV